GYWAGGPDHPVLAGHRRQGGRGFFTRNRRIILAEGDKEITLLPLAQAPLTCGGRIGFHVENLLAATAATWTLGLSPAKIAAGLESFDASLDQAPARFNLLDIQGITVVLDYGHNTSA